MAADGGAAIRICRFARPDDRRTGRLSRLPLLSLRCSTQEQGARAGTGGVRADTRARVRGVDVTSVRTRGVAGTPCSAA